MALKLLQINTVVQYNATGRIADEIGQMALSKGWESYIAYGRFGRSSKSDLIKIGTDLDIKLHGLRSRLFDRHGFGSKHATQELICRIKELEPDIIHLHNIHGYYLNIELLFNYLAVADIPVVWTLHDCWTFTGHCSHFDFVGCEKWKTGCYACPQKRQYPTSVWLDNSKRNYQDKQRLFNSVKNLTIVPVSNWLSNLVRASFLKNYPQQPIHNGVDLKVFSPQVNGKIVKEKIGVANRLLLLGVASVWDSRKGLDDFLKLGPLLNESAVLVLVGLNEEQLKDLPTNVIGISRTENIAQLVDIYSAADLFLNLTYEDSFPTTNLESLACGTPVLTYDTGGSTESVTDDTGFVVEKGYLSGVLDVIHVFKEKGKSEYIKACRNHAEKLFNKNDRYKEYFVLYEKLLSQKSRINK